MRFFVFVALIAPILLGCEEKNADAGKAAHTVLNAVLTCPNDELFDPNPTYIGLEANAPGEEEKSEQEEEAALEYTAWQESVGDCFEKEAFDSFFASYERTLFHGYAKAYDREFSILKMEDQEVSDRVGHILITLQAVSGEAEKETYELDWRVIYSSDSSKLLQKLELVSDGGLGEELVKSGYPADESKAAP